MVRLYWFVLSPIVRRRKGRRAKPPKYALGDSNPVFGDSEREDSGTAEKSSALTIFSFTGERTNFGPVRLNRLEKHTMSLM